MLRFRCRMNGLSNLHCHCWGRNSPNELELADDRDSVSVVGGHGRRRLEAARLTSRAGIYLPNDAELMYLM